MAITAALVKRTGSTKKTKASPVARPFTISRTTDARIVVSVDTKRISAGTVINILNHMQWEDLALRANVDESVLEIGDTIKKEWWQKNKSCYLRGTIG